MRVGVGRTTCCVMHAAAVCIKPRTSRALRNGPVIAAAPDVIGSTMGILRAKRLYEDAASSDGYRVLIDRLWPRGESRQRAGLDEWLKEIAPSSGLRTWWNHDVDRMPEFQERYDAELDLNTRAVHALYTLTRDHDVVTVLYGARDDKVNHARVLLDYMHSRFGVTLGP